MKKQTFPGSERLKSYKEFRRVILEGGAVFQHPVKMLFILLPGEENVPVLLTGFSISRRKHPKATTRNLLKRRMREAFRLNSEAFKSFLGTDSDQRLHLVINYQVGEICDYHVIESAIRKGLLKVQHKIEELRQS